MFRVTIQRYVSSGSSSLFVILVMIVGGRGEACAEISGLGFLGWEVWPFEPLSSGMLETGWAGVDDCSRKFAVCMFFCTLPSGVAVFVVWNKGCKATPAYSSS